MEVFDSLNFEYGLRTKEKASLDLSDEGARALSEFLDIAPRIITELQSTEDLRNYPQEFILCCLVAGDTFGRIRQEERLDTAAAIFTGMLLNSMLATERVHIGVKYSSLDNEDMQAIYERYLEELQYLIRRKSEELALEGSGLMAPLQEYIDQIRGPNEDPSAG